jgi:RNA polymerase sigma factor (sigma-70 family)
MSSGTAFTQLKDEDLVSLCLRGDRRAWEALILRYERLIWAVARRSGLDDPDCADVFQHTSLKLLENLGSLRDRQTLAAWLISITSRQAGEVRRKRRVAEKAVRTLVRETPPSSDLPLSVLESIEERAILRAALDRLSPRCRKIVELTFLTPDKRSYREIGRELGMPEGSVGPTRARCLEKLRVILRDFGVE